MSAPETVTEAVELLQAAGYRFEIELGKGVITCGSCGRSHQPARIVIRETFRFEGDSDPGDEAIVLGVECPDCGARGIIVSAYGPDADPQFLALLDHLSD